MSQKLRHTVRVTITLDFHQVELRNRMGQADSVKRMLTDETDKMLLVRVVFIRVSLDAWSPMGVWVHTIYIDSVFS